MTSATCPSCGGEILPTFRFCGHCGAKLADAPQAARTPTSPAQVEPTVRRDERRQVAVLFADVSGFTAMSDRLDPEEVHATMNACFAGLGQAIRDEAGYIDKYIGDNVMALFGAPIAHEDDAARACRAALAMQAFLQEYSAANEMRIGVALRMRIGINVGLVVAGGVGSDVKMQYSVMGDAVNVASRLESAAEPGCVLVSAAVHDQTRRLFEFGPPQHLSVKGKPDPVPAYQLLSERQKTAAAAAPSSPFVGRAELTAALLRELPPTGQANCRWVQVRGDLGVGKSRLVREALARRGLPVLEVVPTAATSRRPLGVLRRIMQEALGDHLQAPEALESHEAFTQALADLDPQLEPYRPALWYVTAPSKAAAEPPDPDPQAMLRTIARGMVGFLAALARRSPNIVLWVDAYELADEASAILLEDFSQGSGPGITIITTSRTDATRPPAQGVPLVHVPPLTPREAQQLLDGLLDAQPLSDELRSDLLRRAAGVPLFLEELVRVVVESPRNAAESLELPASLRSAMTSRLDRLPPPGRELLCQGSVQGVEFDLGTLAWLRRQPLWAGPPLESAAADLDARGVLRQLDGFRPNWRAFVRPLMQETCYDTMLKRDRRALHAGTADALCALAGGAEHVSPELLAYHQERAERWLEAAQANARAGQRASDLFLNQEALRRFAAALNLLTQVEQDAPARDLAAAIHGSAARVHLRTGDYEKARLSAQHMRNLAQLSADAAEADRLLASVLARTGQTDQAMALLQELVQSQAAGEACEVDAVSLAWHDLAHLHYRAGRLDEARSAVGRCRVTACTDSTLNALRCDLLEGLILHARGEFNQACRLYQRAHAAAERLGSLSQSSRASNSLGNAARDQGDYDQARMHYAQALAAWTRMGDAECIAGAHNNLGNVAMSLGAHEAAADHYRQSMATCTQIGNVHGVALAHANLAILALEHDDPAAAVAEAQASLAGLRTSSDDLLTGLVRVILAEGQLASRQLDEAQQSFEQVLHHHTEADHPLAIAGAKRGLGKLALARGQTDEAVPLLSDALARFVSLKRIQEEARTRLALAECYVVSRQCDAARQQAQLALTQFEEIGAVRDQAVAAALLGRLVEAKER